MHPISETLDGATAPPFAWLLGAGTAPLSPPDQALFDASCGFARDAWHALPVVWPRLQDWAGPALLQSAAAACVRDRLVAADALARLQRRLLERFLGALERRRIPHALLRGDAARILAYPPPAPAGVLAIDLGIAPQAHAEAEGIAREQGFAAAAWSAALGRYEHGASRAGGARRLVRDQVVVDLDAASQAAIRRDLLGPTPWHETAEGELACYVTITLHDAMASGSPIDAAIASAVPIDRDGLSLRVPSPAWTMLELIGALYFEGVSRYRHGGHRYADLLRLVAQSTDRGAERVARMLDRYGMAVPAFYVLRRLPSEFGVALPAPLAALVDRNRRVAAQDTDARAANDLGDVWPKLWGRR